MGRSGGDAVWESLADGREDAYAALFDQFGFALYHTARALLGSSHDAEDAVQEVFVGVVRARRLLAGVTNIKAYLFASLHRAASRIARQRRRRRTVPLAEMEEAPSPSERTLGLEAAANLERALVMLPKEQHEVICLKIDGGLTFAEIALVLEISANTAASRYRYALDKLRTILGEEAHERA